MVLYVLFVAGLTFLVLLLAIMVIDKIAAWFTGRRQSAFGFKSGEFVRHKVSEARGVVTGFARGGYVRVARGIDADEEWCHYAELRRE